MPRHSDSKKNRPGTSMAGANGRTVEETNRRQEQKLHMKRGRELAAGKQGGDGKPLSKTQQDYEAYKYTAKMMKDYDKDTKKKSPKKKGPSGRKSPLGKL
jgi:hypothetical protein